MNIATILETINVNGKKLDVYGTKECPLFLATDISKVIDYSIGNTAHMLQCVDPDDKLMLSVRNSNTSARGNATNKWFLTEDGMYEVLFQSRKPVARRFKRAVKDILHELRMGGKGDFESWMNQSDPLLDEWEAICKFREVAGLEEISFVDFLHEKGYTDDMIV